MFLTLPQETTYQECSHYTFKKTSKKHQQQRAKINLTNPLSHKISIYMLYIGTRNIM